MMKNSFAVKKLFIIKIFLSEKIKFSYCMYKIKNNMNNNNITNSFYQIGRSVIKFNFFNHFSFSKYSYWYCV